MSPSPEPDDTCHCSTTERVYCHSSQCRGGAALIERREDCAVCRLDPCEDPCKPVRIGRLDPDTEKERRYQAALDRARRLTGIAQGRTETYGEFVASAAFTPPPPREDPIWAAIDLDDTLARGTWTPESPTNEIGEPIVRNVEKLLSLYVQGFKIVIHTSRPWFDYELIEAWLRHYKIPFHRIVCGKLWAAIYIDDRGKHASAANWAPHTREERLA